MTFIKISNVRSRLTSRNELERVFKQQLSEALIHTIVVMFESIHLGKR